MKRSGSRSLDELLGAGQTKRGKPPGPSKRPG